MISTCFQSPIEFKNILPVFSLVFFDYYLNLFSNLFFKFEVLEKTLMPRDNIIAGLRAEIRLSYHGTKDIKFEMNRIRVINTRIDPLLIHEDKDYIVIGEFKCLFRKTSNPERIIIECNFNESTTPRISILNYHLYYFKMKVIYTIDYKSNITKNITFMSIRKGA